MLEDKCTASYKKN